MEDFLTGLTALGYATAHISNKIAGELLWGRKHPSVLFVSCLAQRDVGLDTTVIQLLFERKVVLDLMVEGLHA